MIIVIIIAILALVAVIYYVINRFSRTYVAKKLGKDKKWAAYMIAVLIVGLVFLILSLTFSIANAIVILLHFAAFWALLELVFLIVRLITKWDHRKCKYSIIVFIAVPITAIYMTISYNICSKVIRTSYTVNNTEINDNNADKNELKIVQISDSHLGVTVDKDNIGEICEKLQAENPDVLVITGDFVDDASNIEDTKVAVDCISKIKTKYGIYFVFGNHDKGYYNSREYTGDDLIKMLEESGIIVLQDQNVNLGDNYVLVGRQDKSTNSRATMEMLMPSKESGKYYIVLDHQPNDYESEKNVGANLVLSGHTHGGQFIPITKWGEYFGSNDATYGIKRQGNTDFIVSSGLSCWEFPFKTGCVSEYNVIDVK